MMYFRYFRYLARHKWFVLLAGLHMKVSLWQLLIHDWSKFLPCEFLPYMDHFYGPDRGQQNRPGTSKFVLAWMHHVHHNPHHWNHWILAGNSGKTTILEMPEKYVREMLADWLGAGRAITGTWDMDEWYSKNKDKMVMHANTWKLVNQLIPHARAYGRKEESEATAAD